MEISAKPKVRMSGPKNLDAGNVIAQGIKRLMVSYVPQMRGIVTSHDKFSTTNGQYYDRSKLEMT